MMDSVLGRWSPSKLQVVFFLAGVGLMYAGENWGIPMATPIGMACIGLFLAVAGTGMFLQRLDVFRINGWTEAKVVDTYRGLGELLWALLFVFAGLVLTAIVLLNWFWPGLSGTFWSDLLNTPWGLGAILAIIGLMMLLSGLVRALAGSGRVDPQKLGGLPYVLDRLAGAGTFILGTAISAVGLLLLVAPSAVTAAIEGLKHMVVGP